MDIRTASLDDLDLIADLGCRTYRDHFTSIWSERAMSEFLQRDFSEKALQASLVSPTHAWLVLRDAGEPKGFAKINWDRPDPVRQTVGAELQKIYFSSAATGRGYGARLLDAVFGEVGQRAQSWVWLDVLKSNRGAQAFYQKHGFQMIGEIPFSTDKAEIGLFVMARDLCSESVEPLAG
ncbi:GNAT family N-acetyltransferase [Propionivibrio soli]|uniref:GNAT family N-acetyltransferase n=1 Tax=Propionivibrio soli TaxID=2976531 RepID=UPI0021E718A7|nr:GNAT family N-acetyltransferase [Propionivibrio soli]